MRRLLAISLVLLCGLPMVTPLFAQGIGSESDLPACCRRNGAHHCAMTMEQAQALSEGAHVSAVQGCCPAYPKAISPVQHHDVSLDAASLAFAEVVSHPAMRRQTEARARVALDRARRKRGPPAVVIS